MVQTSHLSTWEIEAEGSQVQGQPGLQETLSQKTEVVKRKEIDFCKAHA